MALAFGVFAFVVGLLSFSGWVFNVRRFTVWDGGPISTQPNTALAAVAAGIALVFLSRRPGRVVRVLGIFAGTLGGATLFEHLSGIDLCIDRVFLFGRDWTAATLSPGRMGLPAASCFVMLGTGICLACNTGKRSHHIAMVGASIAAASAFLSITGYVFGASDLYSLPRFTAIALPTAAMILAISVGLIAAMPDTRLIAILNESSSAGLLARWAVPLVVLVPFVTGWLRVLGQRAGYYDASFGTALRTLVEIAVLLVLLRWVVSVIRRHERELESREELNRRVIESSADCIKVLDLDGRMLSINTPGQILFGMVDVARFVGTSWIEAWEGEYQQAARDALQATLRGKTVRFVGLLPALTGEQKWWEVTMSPILDADGHPEKVLAISRDVTMQRRVENAMRENERELQRLVQERTADLEASHRKLRSAERMASLGTLSAGLGHDMGNLLLPMRVRLDSLGAETLSERARDDVKAISQLAEYLQRLTNGLRLLAIDPSRTPSREATSLREWWADAQGVMTSVLPPGVSLVAEFPEDDCAVGMGRAALTQAVFNLIQNAGDVLRDRPAGTVVVRAVTDGDWVNVAVRDDGPGMTPDVRARCMEPFFTTKTRGISTGLGLVLVAGLVNEAGGSIDCISAPGAGTTFTLRLRRGRLAPAATAAPAVARRAVVSINDLRFRAIITEELTSLHYDVSHLVAPDDGVTLSVVDSSDKLPDVQRSASVVLLAPGDPAHPSNVRAIGVRPSIAVLREELRRSPVSSKADGRSPSGAT